MSQGEIAVPDSVTAHHACVVRDLAADAGEVWAVVREFGEADRLIEDARACELLGGGEVEVGCIRRIAFAGTERVYERLIDLDENQQTLAYEFVGRAPFEIRRFVAEIAVEDRGAAGSRVRWEARFEAAPTTGKRTVEQLERLFGGMIDRLGSTDPAERAAR